MQTIDNDVLGHGFTYRVVADGPAALAAHLVPLADTARAPLPDSFYSFIDLRSELGARGTLELVTVACCTASFLAARRCTRRRRARPCGTPFACFWRRVWRQCTPALVTCAAHQFSCATILRFRRLNEDFLQQLDECAADALPTPRTSLVPTHSNSPAFSEPANPTALLKTVCCTCAVPLLTHCRRLPRRCAGSGPWMTCLALPRRAPIAPSCTSRGSRQAPVRPISGSSSRSRGAVRPPTDGAAAVTHIHTASGVQRQPRDRRGLCQVRLP